MLTENRKFTVGKTMLLETLVMSSWLQDISYYGPNNYLFPGEEVITFKTRKSSKTYFIRGLKKADFDKWLSQDSKGKYWHSAIKNRIDKSWLYNRGESVHFKR